MGGSAQYVDERWKWTAGTLYIVLLRSRDSDAVKSQQGLWKTVVRRNPFNGQLMQCTWITTLYGQRSEYIWTHGQWQIARLNGQGSRMRAISVFVCVVTQSWPTLCNPMDCSPPGSSVHVILQARILQWVAISFSRRSSIYIVFILLLYDERRILFWLTGRDPWAG